MVWTDPDSANWDVGDPLTSSDMDTFVRKNLQALKDPPSDNYEADESSDYSTTSTVFVDIDSNFSFEFETNGGDVLVHFHGSFKSTGGDSKVWLDVDVDGSRIAGDDGIIGSLIDNADPGYPISFTRLISGLSAGSHTFTLQWKVGAYVVALYAGAGTSNGDLHPQFWVREVS